MGFTRSRTFKSRNLVFLPQEEDWDTSENNQYIQKILEEEG